MTRAWYRKPRGLRDEPFYQDLDHVGIALVDVLFEEAAYQERQVLFEGEPYTLRPGEMITSENRLAGLVGSTRKIIRNRLETLEKWNWLVWKRARNKYRKGHKSGSLICIKNWDEYFPPEGQEKVQKKDSDRDLVGSEKGLAKGPIQQRNKVKKGKKQQTSAPGAALGDAVSLFNEHKDFFRFRNGSLEKLTAEYSLEDLRSARDAVLHADNQGKVENPVGLLRYFLGNGIPETPDENGKHWLPKFFDQPSGVPSIVLRTWEAENRMGYVDLESGRELSCDEFEERERQSAAA